MSKVKIGKYVLSKIFSITELFAQSSSKVFLLKQHKGNGFI